jgi:hypothetical protein
VHLLLPQATSQRAMGWLLHPPRYAYTAHPVLRRIADEVTGDNLRARCGAGRGELSLCQRCSCHTGLMAVSCIQGERGGERRALRCVMPLGQIGAHATGGPLCLAEEGPGNTVHVVHHHCIPLD